MKWPDFAGMGGVFYLFIDPLLRFFSGEAGNPFNGGSVIAFLAMGIAFYFKLKKDRRDAEKAKRERENHERGHELLRKLEKGEDPNISEDLILNLLKQN